MQYRNIVTPTSQLLGWPQLMLTPLPPKTLLSFKFIHGVQNCEKAMPRNRMLKYLKDN